MAELAVKINKDDPVVSLKMKYMGKAKYISGFKKLVFMGWKSFLT